MSGMVTMHHDAIDETREVSEQLARVLEQSGWKRVTGKGSKRRKPADAAADDVPVAADDDTGE